MYSINVSSALFELTFMGYQTNVTAKRTNCKNVRNFGRTRAERRVCALFFLFFTVFQASVGTNMFAGEPQQFQAGFHFDFGFRISDRDRGERNRNRNVRRTGVATVFFLKKKGRCLAGHTPAVEASGRSLLSLSTPSHEAATRRKRSRETAAKRA